ncbi:MAG: hypothetical protein K2X61_03805 [Caulobacteraceae bacterium]|nr:hypothetical protein [Caulobacteraceae bacterium]
MTSMSLRPFAVDINWGRAFMALALVLGFGFFMVEPAYAFDQFQQKVTQQTAKASGVAKTVLITAAVLSLIVGLAPMLWGQIKVKWIVTALCACVLFGLASIAVTAFSGETPTT